MIPNKDRPEPKKAVPIILGIGLIISIGINAYLFSQFVSANKDITNITAELKNMQTQYESLLKKNENGKQSLSALQVDNSKLEKEISELQTQTGNQQTERQKAPSSTPSKQTTTPSKNTSGNVGNNTNSGSDTYTRQLGVPGTFPPSAGDKDGNGYDDNFDPTNPNSALGKEGTTTPDNIGLGSGNN